jgi:hypothetical protein
LQSVSVSQLIELLSKLLSLCNISGINNNILDTVTKLTEETLKVKTTHVVACSDPSTLITKNPISHQQIAEQTYNANLEVQVLAQEEETRSGKRVAPSPAAGNQQQLKKARAAGKRHSSPTTGGNSHQQRGKVLQTTGKINLPNKPQNVSRK